MFYKMTCLTAMTLFLAEGCVAPPPTAFSPTPRSTVIPPTPSTSPNPPPAKSAAPPSLFSPALAAMPSLPSLVPTPNQLPSATSPSPTSPTPTAGPNEIVGILAAKLPYDYGSGEAMSETMRNLVKDKVFTIEAYSVQPFYGVVRRTQAKIGEPFRIKDIPLNTAMQLDISTPWVSFTQGNCKADAVFVSKTQSFILTGQPLLPIELRLYETLANQHPFPPECTLRNMFPQLEQIGFNGQVFDDTNAPLDGVKLTARSLNASVPYVAETTSTGGTYAFGKAYSGIQVEIVASKPGFTTRKRVEVLTGLSPGNGSDVLPSFAATGVTYTQNRSLNLFSSGDQVQVTVAETVVDPAGNPMRTDQRTATGTVP